MNWFRKKKNTEPTPIIEFAQTPQPCTHTWQDFPWYIEDAFSDDVSEVWIKEPYVCIHCGERKDEILYHRRTTDMSHSQHLQRLKDWAEEYKEHVLPRAVVEDQVYDMKYVDRERLQRFKNYKLGEDKNVPCLRVSRLEPKET